MITPTQIMRKHSQDGNDCQATVRPSQTTPRRRLASSVRSQGRTKNPMSKIIEIQGRTLDRLRTSAYNPGISKPRNNHGNIVVAKPGLSRYPDHTPNVRQHKYKQLKKTQIKNKMLLLIAIGLCLIAGTDAASEITIMDTNDLDVSTFGRSKYWPQIEGFTFDKTSGMDQFEVPTVKKGKKNTHKTYVDLKGLKQFSDWGQIAQIKGMSVADYVSRASQEFKPEEFDPKAIIKSHGTMSDVANEIDELYVKKAKSTKRFQEKNRSPKEYTLYDRHMDLNKKYLSLTVDNEHLKDMIVNSPDVITHMTFNILDQDLSGPCGGFRINCKELDSDEVDEDWTGIMNKEEYEIAKDNGDDEDWQTRTVDWRKLSPRLKRSYQIILEKRPDIVTIQECDREEELKQLFGEQLGYECHYNKKVASAANNKDGVAILFNTAKFRALYEHPRPIFLPSAKKGKVASFKEGKNGKPGQWSEAWGKQVGMWMLLQNRFTGRPVVAMVSHNKSGVEAGEDGYVKKAQAQRLAEIITQELGEDIPIIYGCDFNNSTQTTSYEIFEKEVPFLADAQVDVYGKKPKWGSSKWRNAGGQPQKVGYTPNDIDFLFYSKKHFKALAVLGYPTVDLETSNMPGYRYPSDHFAHFAVYQEYDLSAYELAKKQEEALEAHNQRRVRIEEKDRVYKAYVIMCNYISENPETNHRELKATTLIKWGKTYCQLGEKKGKVQVNTDFKKITEALEKDCRKPNVKSVQYYVEEAMELYQPNVMATRPCDCPFGELYRHNGFLPLAEDFSDDCQCRGTGEVSTTNSEGRTRKQAKAHKWNEKKAKVAQMFHDRTFADEDLEELKKTYTIVDDGQYIKVTVVEETEETVQEADPTAQAMALDDEKLEGPVPSHEASDICEADAVVARPARDTQVMTPVTNDAAEADARTSAGDDEESNLSDLSSDARKPLKDILTSKDLNQRRKTRRGSLTHTEGGKPFYEGNNARNRKRWGAETIAAMKAKDDHKNGMKKQARAGALKTAKESPAFDALLKWKIKHDKKETGKLPSAAQLSKFSRFSSNCEKVQYFLCRTLLNLIKLSAKKGDIETFLYDANGGRYHPILPNVGRRLAGVDLADLTSEQRRLVDKVRQGRRLTEQELPRSYLHTAEEVLARRRLIHGVQTPPTLAALLREIEEQD